MMEERCVFDWQGGESPLPGMQGGYVSYETEFCYTYSYGQPGQAFTSGLIIPKAHVLDIAQLPAEVWAQIGEHFTVIAGQYHELNLSFNYGYVAGQRIAHPHGHVIRRETSKPSSTLGLKTLIRLYDELASQK